MERRQRPTVIPPYDSRYRPSVENSQSGVYSDNDEWRHLQAQDARVGSSQRLDFRGSSIPENVAFIPQQGGVQYGGSHSQHGGIHHGMLQHQGPIQHDGHPRNLPQHRGTRLGDPLLDMPHLGGAQQGGPDPGMPQHRGPDPGMPQHRGPDPGMPQHRGPDPGMPQHRGPDPGMPQHRGPDPGMPQHRGPDPGMPQHRGPDPGMPQHRGPDPGMPQHRGPHPEVPPHRGLHPGMPQHIQPHPGVPQFGGQHPGVPQHREQHPGVPQHREQHPGVPQFGGPHPGVPHHGGTNPGVPQHGGPPNLQPNMPQHGEAQPVSTLHGEFQFNKSQVFFSQENRQSGRSHYVDSNLGMCAGSLSQVSKPGAPHHDNSQAGMYQHRDNKAFVSTHVNSQSGISQPMSYQCKPSQHMTFHNTQPTPPSNIQHGTTSLPCVSPQPLLAHRAPSPHYNSIPQNIPRHFPDPASSATLLPFNAIHGEDAVLGGRGMSDIHKPAQVLENFLHHEREKVQNEKSRYQDIYNEHKENVHFHPDGKPAQIREPFVHFERTYVSKEGQFTRQDMQGDYNSLSKDMSDPQKYGPVLYQHGLKMQGDGNYLHRNIPNLQTEGPFMQQQQQQKDLQRSQSLFQQDGPNIQRDGPFLHEHGQRAPNTHMDEPVLYQHGPNVMQEGLFRPQDISNLESRDALLHQDNARDVCNTHSDCGKPPWKDQSSNHTVSNSDNFFRQWLSNFLAQRRKNLSSKPEPAIVLSIKDARELVYGTFRLLAQLTDLCKSLEQSTENVDSWTQNYQKAANVRAELEKRMKTLEKPQYIEDIKKKLDKIRKKRLRQQRLKQGTEEDKQKAELAAEKEARIDRWRMQRVHEVEEKKRERELKAAADSVLSEVRKKQADAKKMLDVLRSLEKLRKLRKEAAARKGVYPLPSDDETFENHIRRLRAMVHKRTALYDAEERALRVILEGEQEEERQREKEKRLKKERGKLLKQQEEVDSILFGDPDPLPPLHPLQPFRQYHLQAEHSVVSLVHIRHEWDQFLASAEHPDASSIPRGWILPVPPTSDTWATALQQSE
ncbi:programmed cell death protein 7 [Bombina bombina]|uniref:programmed cell death protein 7 n=1 Tax=Bombina bombina TaxID=8345 RepID=UPI00235AAEA0|nr:programmed cell death protein 7 [Bombina bombina]